MTRNRCLRHSFQVMQFLFAGLFLAKKRDMNTKSGNHVSGNATHSMIQKNSRKQFVRPVILVWMVHSFFLYTHVLHTHVFRILIYLKHPHNDNISKDWLPFRLYLFGRFLCNPKPPMLLTNGAIEDPLSQSISSNEMHHAQSCIGKVNGRILGMVLGNKASARSFLRSPRVMDGPRLRVKDMRLVSTKKHCFPAFRAMGRKFWPGTSARISAQTSVGSPLKNFLWVAFLRRTVPGSARGPCYQRALPMQGIFC